MTMTLTREDELAERYYAALHATCSYLAHRRRRECAWAPSGYCWNCGRPRPTLLPNQPGTLSTSTEDHA